MQGGGLCRSHHLLCEPSSPAARMPPSAQELHQRLQSVRFQTAELVSLIDADEKRRIARHNEEKAVTEQLVNSLQQVGSTCPCTRVHR